jgi:hypothetical protein
VTATTANLLAMHGLRCRLPDDWEPVGTYGTSRKGYVLVAEGREARLSVSWERDAITPDLERSLSAVGKRLRREHGCGEVAAREAVGRDGLMGHWDSPAGEFHAAVRHFPEAKLTLIARQLAPGPAAPVRQAVSEAEGWAEHQSAPWQLYGLDLMLPPWWRLEGIQQLAGLVRGVWFHHPDGKLRVDQVLVVRRFACASRLIAGTTFAAWIKAGLQARERVEAENEADGVLHLGTLRPGKTWWRRLRGQEERRDFHAWIEDPADRMVLQEWSGEGRPLPCLRRTQSPQG